MKLDSAPFSTKIDFLDSSGLGALVQLAKQCTDAKRSFLLVGNTRVTQTIKLVANQRRGHKTVATIPAGKLALSVDVSVDGKIRGPHQVILTRK